MPVAPSNLSTFESIKEIVAALRGPEGCPWDKDQTHQSLTPFAIEEVYELIETIENHDDSSMREELGDVLFQVILHSQLASERGAFNIDEVIFSLNQKMIRRHPHVFGAQLAKNKEEVLTQWEIIKSKEKKESLSSPSQSPFNNIPKNLPSLQRAYKIGNKTNKTGFDWTSSLEVKVKILEELEEVEELLPQSNLENNHHINKPALDSENHLHIEEELGDLLFTVAQYARHLGHDPETCLRKANAKFEKRYQEMLLICQELKVDFTTLSSVEKELLWKKVKEVKQ